MPPAFWIGVGYGTAASTVLWIMLLVAGRMLWL